MPPAMPSFTGSHEEISISMSYMIALQWVTLPRFESVVLLTTTHRSRKSCTLKIDEYLQLVRPRRIVHEGKCQVVQNPCMGIYLAE